MPTMGTARGAVTCTARSIVPSPPAVTTRSVPVTCSRNSSGFSAGEIQLLCSRESSLALLKSRASGIREL